MKKGKKIKKESGVKKCLGCQKAKDNLNILGHQSEYFYKKNNPNAFTDDDLIEWELFIGRTKPITIGDYEQKLIIRLLKDIINMSVKYREDYENHVWDKYIKMIQTVYERNSQL